MKRIPYQLLSFDIPYPRTNADHMCSYVEFAQIIRSLSSSTHPT